MDQSGALVSTIQILRAPSGTVDDSKLKVKRVAYCLPQIRNPQNVWLLLNELALSPKLLAFTEYENLEIGLLAVDGITYAAQRKSRVSDPTLNYDEWAQQLIKCAYRVPPVFGLIIVAGLSAQPSFRANLLPSFIGSVLPNGDNAAMALLAAGCLARAQWSPLVYRTAFAQLPSTTRSILLRSIENLVFDTVRFGFDSALVYGDYASWSRTLGKLLESGDLSSLRTFLYRLNEFVQYATKNVPSTALELLKKLAFGVTMQIEGLVSQLVTSPLIPGSQRVELAGKSLACLQPLGIVYEFVGTQFSSYQFVLQASLDILVAASPRERLEVLHVLGDRWGNGKPVRTEYDAGDLLFFLNICEPLILVLTTREAQHTVVPIAQQHLVLNQTNLKLSPAVFEAAHAVMLSFFASHSDQRDGNVNESALTYFDQLVKLFPQSISGQQLVSAVSAVLRAVSPPNKDLILLRLFTLAKEMIPGTEIPVKGEDTGPPTLRSAVISALLQGVAQYASGSELQAWLPRISSMVPLATSPATQHEREYLVQTFRDVVTSMGELSDIGIRWFFNEGWSRL